MSDDGERQYRVPAEVMCEYVLLVLEEAGGTVGSRHLGRELTKIIALEDGTTALSAIKEASSAEEENVSSMTASVVVTLLFLLARIHSTFQMLPVHHPSSSLLLAI